LRGCLPLNSSLSNDGERLTLLASNGAPIADLTYRPSAPWPSAANGGGASLVLIRPATNDPSVASNWRASTTLSGAPGVDDRLLYAAWRATHFTAAEPGMIGEPTADPDGDGMSNLMEYSLGTNPRMAAV
jgi:hypothetical protein